MRKVGSGMSGKVFFRRTVMSAREAVAWYRSFGQNGAATPLPAPPDEAVQGRDGVDLEPTSFEDDPQWPSLGIPLGADVFSEAAGAGDPAPFRGSGAPRIHRRFGDGIGFSAVLADQAALDFLARRLHVDLATYEEYLGGLALVVPDPILRRVEHYLVPPREAGAEERVVFRVMPRPDQRIENLELTVLERRSNLLSRFQTVEVPSDGIVSIASTLPFDQTGYVLSHAEQGVIAYQQPLPFVRSISVSVGVSGRKVKVSVPTTEGASAEPHAFETTELGGEEARTIGEARKDAITKVVAAEQRRVRRSAAARYRQRWFAPGTRDEAIAFLREQLMLARSSVLVADPYFGARQILQFLHAVPRTHVAFTILTSRHAFEAGRPPEAGGDADGGSVAVQTRVAEFEGALDTLRDRRMRSVTALVLAGRDSPLHDRFLVIDDDVLFLGNSLNTLGERASLIVGVPDGEPVRAKLDAMSREAQSFEDYASRHGLRQPLPPDPS